jgi:hypothetical protein
MSAEDEESYGLKPYPEARVWRIQADGRNLSELHAASLAWCLGRENADIEQKLAHLSEVPAR